MPEPNLFSQPIQLGITVGLLIIIWKISPFLISKLNKNGNGASNPTFPTSSAGYQSIEYWELKTRQIMNENQKPVLDILSQQTQILRELSITQREMNTILKMERDQ